MRHISPVATLFAVAVLPLALTACSTTPKAAPSTAPKAAAPKAAATPEAAAGAPATDGPNKGLLTGTQLKAALAPASFFATGYTADPADARDTGPAYRKPVTADVPTPDCTLLGGTAWTNITGITGVSFAQNAYVNKNTSEEYAQEIDVYQGTTSTKVLGALGMLSKACPSYTDEQTHGKVTVTEKPLAGVGDGAWAITETSAAWDGGTTLVAARVGTSVVTVLVSSSGTDKGLAGATKLTNQLVGNLKGKA
ncbi:hypothetical protein BX286_4123 [Streptomyces sp. 3211.6]|uniref:hypothetical protein n=1 Tax=Streptomyces TaxID=1883 RepID=UPI0009A53E8E|nr:MULTISPECIES: hypothetical protein [Streptomyces]RKT06085.1 hypothetical protein BX286_4123 [Streptomyces sp. 3211.6]RPF46375.1 hypothetical protein EDD96_2946 [Streptomyces sp. Ag109_G2-6]